MPTTIKKAGAIILNDKNEVLLIYRKQYSDWTFPKGHIEPGEDALTTLRREAKEETGFEVEPINPLPPFSYIDDKKNKCELTFYTARILSGEMKPEFPGDQVLWVPLGKASKKLTYQNLKEYYSNVRPLM